MFSLAIPAARRRGGVAIGETSFIGSHAQAYNDNGGALAFSSLKDSASATPTLAEGDVALCFIGRTGFDGIVEADVIPSGYTKIATRFSGSGGAGLSFKFMGASPDTSLTVPDADSPSNVGTCTATLHVFRGVDPTIPLATSAVVTAGGSAPNPGAVHFAGPGLTFFVAGFAQDGNGAGSQNLSRPSALSSETNHFRSVTKTYSTQGFTSNIGAGFATGASDPFDCGAFGISDDEANAMAFAIALQPYAVPSYNWTATVTVASGTVGSNLTNFPLYIDLADMPSAFWAATSGTDIRAFVGGSQVPCDVLWCDPVTETGRVFVKVPTLASGSDTTITLQGTGNTEYKPTNYAYGRNAVWSDYDTVSVLGITGGEERTGKATLSLTGDNDLFALHATSSADTNSHQGACWDGTYYYTVDDNYIRKWDASWTLVDSNSDPIGDSGVTTSPAVNHLGDPDHFDGKLYIPLEYYSGGTHSGEHIAVYDASDLSFIEAFDISAQGHEVSSVCYCDRDGLLYVSDYVGGTFHRYRMDGTYHSEFIVSPAIPQPQGITWWRGCFWISQDANDETHRVTFEGAGDKGNLSAGGGGIGFGGDLVTGNYEGIGHTDEGLLQSIDPGATERVEEWRPIQLAKAAGGGVTFSAGGRIEHNGLSSRNTYTMGVTLNLSGKTGNHCAASYLDTGVAGSSNARQVIAYRHTSTTIAVWDANNSWLFPTVSVNPTIGTSYRCHAVYNGTTDRKLYVDGTVRGTQSGISNPPSGRDTLWLGQEDEDDNEHFTGKVGFAYIRPSALSADWIAAEYANLNNPSSFYSIS